MKSTYMLQTSPSWAVLAHHRLPTSASTTRNGRSLTDGAHLLAVHWISAVTQASHDSRAKIHLYCTNSHTIDQQVD
jgi:hypothetical protein